MSKVFETPLEVFADPDAYVFEINDKNGDLVASYILNLEQAKMLAAVPELYEACRFHCETRCKMRNLNKNVCKHCVFGKALRKARGESEAK